MHVYQPNEILYRAAREGTVYCRLDRGVIRGTGNDRLDLIHRLSTGDVGGLKTGEEGITILTSDKGRVLEVLRILAFDNHTLMVLLGKDVESVRAWLEKYTIMDDFTTEDATSQYGLLGLYGEGAKQILEKLFGVQAPDNGKIAVSQEYGGAYIIRDIRLNGSGSFTLIAGCDVISSIEESLKNAGCSEIDEETRQALRIAVGQPEMKTELTGEYNPLEAGLVSWISFTKGCYIGQEVIARLDTYDKVKRRLVGIRLVEGAETSVQSDGTTIGVREPVENVAIGTVTSLTVPYDKAGLIGLCYIRSAWASPGLPVVLTADDGSVIAKGELTKLPF